jgi:hypothetical protein
MRTRIQRLIARIVLFFIYRFSAWEMRRRGITDPIARRRFEWRLLAELTENGIGAASRWRSWRP